jgi:itaconate CoA-transferase
VLQDITLLSDPRCANNAARCLHRDRVDGQVAAVFGKLSSAEVMDRMTAAQTAYGNLKSVHDLIEHPPLRTQPMAVGGRMVELPASPWQAEWEQKGFAPAPCLDEHGAALREEFAPPVG